MRTIALSIYLPNANFRIPNQGLVQDSLWLPPPMTMYGWFGRVIGVPCMPKMPAGDVFVNAILHRYSSTIMASHNQPKTLSANSKLTVVKECVKIKWLIDVNMTLLYQLDDPLFDAFNKALDDGNMVSRIGRSANEFEITDAYCDIPIVEADTFKGTWVPERLTVEQNDPLDPAVVDRHLLSMGFEYLSDGKTRTQTRTQMFDFSHGRGVTAQKIRSFDCRGEFAPLIAVGDKK